MCLRRVPIIGPRLLTIGKRFFDPAWHIQRVFQRSEQVYVVQIGSNDGKTEDPLHDLLANNKGWAALLIEPVPFLFEKLRANYGEESRFRFENVAIAQETQQTPFYYILEEAEDAIPRPGLLMGSFAILKRISSYQSGL